MGWLPIALALAGFVFFVAIVNYNSIKRYKKAIMMAFFQFCQAAKARHTLLQSLGLTAGDQPCHVRWLEDEFRLQHFPEYVACIKYEIKSIEDSRLFIKMNPKAGPEARKALKSLQVLNHRQFINIKVFRRKVREYNQLIDSIPTKWVARFSGQKPLRF